MKTLYRNWVVLLSCLLGMVACSEEEVTLTKTGQVKFDLNVQDIESIITRSDDINVDDFIVTIKGDNYQKEKSYAELKGEGTLELPAGIAYTFEAVSSATDPDFISQTPFYKGSKEETILGGEIVAVNLACAMTQVGLSIDLSALSSLSNLAVSIRKGSTGTLYPMTVKVNQKTEIYYVEPSDDLQLVIAGKTSEGYELGTLGIKSLAAEGVDSSAANTLWSLKITIDNSGVRSSISERIGLKIESSSIN